MSGKTRGLPAVFVLVGAATELSFFCGRLGALAVERVIHPEGIATHHALHGPTAGAAAERTRFAGPGCRRAAVAQRASVVRAGANVPCLGLQTRCDSLCGEHAASSSGTADMDPLHTSLAGMIAGWCTRRSSLSGHFAATFVVQLEQQLQRGLRAAEDTESTRGVAANSGPHCRDRCVL